MAIVQQGEVNTTALGKPQVLINIVPPKTVNLNGVPTDRIVLVGTAADGPVDTPVVIGDMAAYEANFGKPQNRDHDIGTVMAAAVLQGARNFVVIRRAKSAATATKALSFNVDVEGTPTPTLAITLTARYTGTGGNDIGISFRKGSAANTLKAVLIKRSVQEVYDNLPTTGFWAALADAINSGNAAYAKAGKPSALVTASLSGATYTAAPTAADTFTFLAGGTDGADTVTDSDLLGAAADNSGMYAARKTGASICVLCDVTDPNTWSEQAAFGKENAMLMIAVGAKGDSLADAETDKHAAGVDDYSMWLIFGDWPLFYDGSNGITRYVSPQGFAAGRIAMLSPEQSPLNKPVYGVIGSQKVGEVGSGKIGGYSDAELNALSDMGIDVLTNPAPGGGDFWSFGLALNTSSNANIRELSYTRMTNYIASTLNKGMGQYLGRVINRDTFRDVKTTLESFLGNMLQQGMLARDESGKLPFVVICDASNNPAERQALGYLQADVQVRYQAITRYFVINVEGGQTVKVTVKENA